MNSDDLERRIYELMDGRLPEPDAAALVRAIATDPEAREIYSHCCRLDSALHRLARSRGALGAVAREPVIPLMRGRGRQLWASVGAAAAVITAVACLLHFVILPLALPPVALSCGPNSILTVTSSAKDAPAETDYLRKGSVLRLEQGSVALQFRTGVRAVLRAPAHLVLDGPEQVTLHSGHAWFHVPDGAQGFRAVTPELEVVDLGTEFGVLSEAGRSDEVHVFHGRVSVRHRLAAPAAVEEISRGQARRATPRRTLVAVAADPAAFATTVEMNLRHVGWDFEESSGARFAASGSHPAVSTATATAGPQPARRVPGPRGQALALGPGGSLRSDWQGVLGSHPRTITAWIRVPAAVPDGELPASIAFWGREGDDLAMSKWRIGLNPESQGEGGVKGALRTEFGFGWVIGSTDLRDGRWHHIASVYQGGNGPDNTARILLYVDGALESVSAGQHQQIDTRAGDPVVLGGRNGRVEIDEFRIYDSALDAAAIAELATPPPAGPGQ